MPQSETGAELELYGAFSSLKEIKNNPRAGQNLIVK